MKNYREFLAGFNPFKTTFKEDMRSFKAIKKIGIHNRKCHGNRSSMEDLGVQWRAKVKSIYSEFLAG
jgi:hypothetical protein